MMIIKCESCDQTLLPTMKASLKLNICPFCGKAVMANPHKVEQYHHLLNLLDNTIFTDDQKVDDKIREKVASLMISNFVFKKMESVVSPKKEDLTKIPKIEIATKEEADGEMEEMEIKLPENIQTVTSTGKKINQIDEQAIINAPARKTPQKRVSPKIDPNKKIGTLSARDYLTAQEENIGDIEDDSSSPEMSAEEIMKTFPGMTPEQAASALQQEVNNMQRHQQYSIPKKGSTGNGIRRL